VNLFLFFCKKFNFNMAGKNGFGRLQVIDSKLRSKKCTWEELAETCKDALSLKEAPSKRTILGDIMLLRDYYHAPIPIGKPTYYYTDRTFSIFNNPLSIEQVSTLKRLFDVVKNAGQLAIFDNLTDELFALVEPIDTHRSTKKTSPISIERIDIAEGMQFISVLYQAILSRSTVELTYQAFDSIEPKTFIFHPYYLKEFNKRWFVFGWNDSKKRLENYALDRIKNAPLSSAAYRENDVDFEHYFDNMIGVSRQDDSSVEEIHLWFHRKRAPYVLTKPLHTSQRLISENTEGVVLAVDLVINRELESAILEFGADVEVLLPLFFRERFASILEKAQKRY
jgi:predicted DNA-binding transcriptional regulator YafY